MKKPSNKRYEPDGASRLERGPLKPQQPARIALVVVQGRAKRTPLVSLLRRATGRPVADLIEALAIGSPVAQYDLYGRHHGEVAPGLLRLLADLERMGAEPRPAIVAESGAWRQIALAELRGRIGAHNQVLREARGTRSRSKTSGERAAAWARGRALCFRPADPATNYAIPGEARHCLPNAAISRLFRELALNHPKMGLMVRAWVGASSMLVGSSGLDPREETTPTRYTIEAQRVVDLVRWVLDRIAEGGSPLFRVAWPSLCPTEPYDHQRLRELVEPPLQQLESYVLGVSRRGLSIVWEKSSR
jgi:hypothetical protein